MYTLTLLFMKFILFSIIGYVVEMITCAIIEHRWTNRGFLCGPMIPIYGIGSLLLVWVLKPFKEHLLLVIFLGMLLTTTIEYITGYVLEKIFHNKWWDYSHEKFNIHGYVCLKNAILFAIGTPIIVYIVDPYITSFLLQIKDSYLYVIAFIVFLVFLFDVIYSVIVAYNLRNRLIVVENLKNEKLARIPGMLESILKKRIKHIRKYPKRLLKAFPDIMNSKEKEFDLMKKIALKEKEKKKQDKQSKKKKQKKQRKK